MGVRTLIQNFINRLFKPEIESRFDTELQISTVMESAIDRYYSITSGHPYWENPGDDIESLNMAGFISDVTAELTTLGIRVNVGNSEREKALQEQADYVQAVLTDKVSEALGNVGIMFKPNGETVDYYEAGTFAPTQVDSNGNIRGCIFQTKIQKNRTVYTRIEWHRFEDNGLYHITNYAYKATANKGYNAYDIGTPCELTEIKEWAGIEPDVYLENVEKPLFAFFKNPTPNRVDRTSALGVPVWAYCLNELRDLDVAWSRKSTEIEDSKHVTFMPQSAVQYADSHNASLPRYVRGVEMGVGVAADSMIHEHVSTLKTEQRISDINATLAMISTKCGFSQGMFQLNERTGVMTATQIEADDQETIRTIKSIRDALKKTLYDLLYACNVMLDLYSDVAPEPWETVKESITFDFDDITYNYEEDRALWWNYRLQGDVPPYMYYTKFEGMTEEEAKKMLEEAKEGDKKETSDNEGLFGDRGFTGKNESDEEDEEEEEGEEDEEEDKKKKNKKKKK